MEQQTGPRPETQKDEGRFFDNFRRGAEIAATLGAGAGTAWFANYQVDVPVALAIGVGALAAVGAIMAGLEAKVLAAYKADSEKRMRALFSQESEKYVPPPADTDEVIRRAGQKRR